MKISIITAVRNRESTIGKCIASLYSQAYRNFEHIIVDGGSTDLTLAIVRESVDDRAIISSETDDGVCDAFNKGLARATGDIIGFLHSDDFFADESALSMIADAFTRYDCDYVYGDLDYVRKNDSALLLRRWKSGRYAAWKLRLGWMPPHPTFFIHRRVLNRIGGFDCRYKISCDYDFILRCLGSEDVAIHYIEKVLVKMRAGGLSNGSIRQIVSKSSEDLHIIRKNRVFPGLSWVVLLLKNLQKLPQFFIVGRKEAVVNSEGQ